jgi:glutamine amidotransferase
MASPKITVIDTGYANLSSVKIALEKIKADAKISYDPDDIRKADKLILPGVGTASAAMEKLRSRKLEDLIVSAKQPLLGICLGMQMLAENSEEDLAENSAAVRCLGIIKSNVRIMKTGDLRLPHMGWNQIRIIRDHPIFRDIPDNSYFYFVHSYCMELNSSTIAECSYGEEFTAVVASGNFIGTQFHPEKSGAVGSKLLSNFVEM